MRRIITLDIVRGGAAIGVFTVHAVLFQILAGVDNSVTTFTEVLGIFILPIEIIIASAGLFVLIAGISNAGIMYHLLKAGKKPKTLLKDTLITNGAIIVTHYIFVILFTHYRGVGSENYFALITGLFEQLSFNIELTGFSWQLLFYNDALLMIGFGGIFSSFILIGFHKYTTDNESDKIYYILFAIATIILFTSQILRDILNPFLEIQLQEGHYFVSTLISWISAPRHSILPFSAYSLYGAIIGLGIYHGKPKKFILKFGYITGIFYVIMGIIFVYFMGIPDLRIPEYPINIYLLSFGFMLIFTTFLICKYEFASHEKRLIALDKTIDLRRYGLASLSVYMLEAPIGAIIAWIFNLIWPGIIQNVVFGLFVYLPILIFLWKFILTRWERINFKYSVEWFITTITSKLRGRKSSKMNIQKNLYHPIDTEVEIIEKAEKNRID